MASEAPLTSPTRLQLSTSIILNRSPILTPVQSDFQKAYHEYQYKIHRAFANPFPKKFYFKEGTTLEQRFQAEEKLREREAFGIGFGSKGKKTALPPDSGEQPLPRETEADQKMDITSLDRAGDRNLYLLLKTKSGWRFPQGVAQPGDALHVAARKQILQDCGEDIDTWLVGRQPIGFLEDKEKIFFFKAHVFAGQVSSTNDFAWLTKQEIKDRVDEQYWSGVKDMLSEC
ncbi:54S ribosomal protein L17 mitochondrial [Tulasnella sp. 419]|nr:54S ribosomal protein L17 mitochondrial [Tulasnella sp. 419]